MSAHGHGRRGSSPQLLWALPVLVAALIGGLAAAALVHVSLAVAVPVSVAIGAVAAFAVIRWPGKPVSDQARPAGSHRTPPRATAPVGQVAAPSPAPASSMPTMPPAPSGALRPQGTQSDAVVQLLPVSPGRDGEAPWWDAAQGGPPASSAAARRAPAPDLSSYLASTIIAQCPNCGAFRLDFRRARHGWDFRCESCRYTWTWQPDTPWPPVRVAPGRRRELHPLTRGNIDVRERYQPEGSGLCGVPA
jgi:rubredoxin